MATTLKAARRALLRRHQEDLGIIRPVTALAVGSVTVGSLANTNLLAGKFSNTILARYDAASAADLIRYGGDLTPASGLIAHTGANYADTTATDEFLEIWYDPEIRPDIDILDCLQYAHKRRLVECYFPLAHGNNLANADWDMQDSLHAFWDDSNATFVKQSTAAEVYPRGARSGTLTLSAGGGYTQSNVLLPWPKSGIGMMFGFVRADIGTGIFRVLDQDGNTVDDVDFTEREWLLVMKQFQVGSGDKSIRARLLGTDNLDQIDVTGLWFVNPNILLFNLPTNIPERAKVTGVSVGMPRQQGSDDYTWLAGSLSYEKLEEQQHFRFLRPRADANPYQIEILPAARHLLRYPLFITVDCPYSAPYGVTVAFSAETDETDCPEDELVAETEIEMATRWPKRFGSYKALGEATLKRLAGEKHRTDALPPDHPLTGMTRF